MNYLTLLEIADLLAELLDFEGITAGCIDGCPVLSTASAILRSSRAILLL